MGRKYNFEFCSRCKIETWHRVFKRYGKAAKGRGKGRKGLRRIVTWCLTCQKRRIDNQRKKRRKKQIISRE